MQQQPTTLAALQQSAVAQRAAPIVPGFGSSDSFELMVRQSKLLAATSLVPATYRQTIEKLDKYGNVKSSRDNPNALANCCIALNMATRMQADPVMVMQNLYIVEGRPSWSSQWIIASINQCGRFSPLRYDMEDLGEKEVEYTVTEWIGDERVTKKKKEVIRNLKCIAWAIEKGSNERLTSPVVTVEMAVKEGWYQKNGSKWQTMPEIMLRYRCASFFGKLYAPELLMGIPSQEEAQELVIDAAPQADGSYAVSMDSLREAAASAGAAQEQTPAPEPVGEVIEGRTAERPDDAHPGEQVGGFVDAGNGQQIDTATGEVHGAAHDAGPTLDDVLDVVNSGDFDMARDMARDMSADEKRIVEGAIADRQPKPTPAPQQRRTRADRGGLALD